MNEIKEECLHPNKIITDEPDNFDGEFYYECPDCGAGWRERHSEEDEEL